ncbi:MAG: molybdopterin molybdenumtransferase MoeA [Bacteroidetes bacterium]|nr:molybdopterin molybdenumtransferase MoeA [Bacteroidota bacterium]
MKTNISVAEAESIILSNLFIPREETVSSSAMQGRVLAEDIKADRDFPPFNRVAMDGICIRFEDYSKGIRNFKITGVQAAGAESVALTGTGNAIEVMTGAILPENADVVIRYEDLEIVDDEATLKISSVREWQNIHLMGSDHKKGDEVMPAGIKINYPETGVISTVGIQNIKVKSLPEIAVISTGNELVDIKEIPLPHQIRKSNVHVLRSMCERNGIAGNLFHFNDDRDEMEAGLKSVLKDHDCLLLSGAVSMGKFDFLPEVLIRLGVKPLFHRVEQRPGKPFWFGVTEDSKAVFAFPGNPVSTTICARRFFLPWLWRSMGISPLNQFMQIESEIEFKPNLTYFLPVIIDRSTGKAIPKPGHGSGDLANLVGTDGFVELPAHETIHSTENTFPFYFW